MYLNCHSYFSFRYGTISPEDLLKDATQNGIASLALTDINNTSGVLDFVRLAPRHKIKPVIGIDFRNGNDQKFIGIARNNEGFRELNDFLSHHLHNGDEIPGDAPIFFHSYIIYPFKKDFRALKDNEFIGIRPGEVNRFVFTEWKKHPHKLVILSPVTFRDNGGYSTHRLLRAIDKNVVLSRLDKAEEAAKDEIMLNKYELIKIYGDYRLIIENTEKLLDNCSVNFEFGKSKNKKTFTGNFYEDELLLKKLCSENLKYRYPNPDKTIKERLNKEIKVITELGYASYFLINYDIIKYAQHKNFYYVGRGSGANSMVAYVLRITDVDPIDLDLYFERFMNIYRTSPPDFDLDFSWKDRDEIIEYIFQTHGATHTAQLATYSTFQANSVIRELGKVFGLPKVEIDDLSENKHNPQTPDNITKLIKKYSQFIHDLPNHLSIHAGGILISELPIHYYTATTIPPKGFPLTQFSMLEAEDIGLYKFDILSQRGLGHIKDAVELVEKNQGIKIDIHDVPAFKKDEKVKVRLREARCMGCFYIESPAMRMLLRKLEVDNYLGLVAASSIIRPGVASSGMMKEYILRYRKMKPTYQTPKEIYDILKETYGVMVYQEDVIKVAHYFAGLTLGEADMLRRGMSGKYRGREEFEKVKNKFFSNCTERKIDDAIAKEVWRQIESFAGYAFSKGHSASYAVESYQSLFLKAYYPLEHMVGVINNFGGFFRTEFYVHEARMCGGAIHAPDINRSEDITSINGKDIYLGFAHVQSLEKKVREEILNERGRNGAFNSLADFMKRVSIAVEQLRVLIRAGAFRFTGRTKKQLLWDIHIEVGASKKTVAKKELFEVEQKEYILPPLYHGRLDDAFDEMELLDFPLCSPFELIFRSTLLTAKGVSAPITVELASELKNHTGKIIEITGYYVTSKHTQTKHKEHMMFGTFLDREGFFFDTVHFPKIAAQFPFTGRGCYCIKGKVAEEFGFYSLDVVEMKRLDFISKEEILQVQ
ncbi:MAG TPA: DNA polymerase III subunit alpha [Bacteroidia bacterium]|nr:DNA polymerase III subunit alpha [Bacteroidia bacterium]